MDDSSSDEEEAARFVSFVRDHVHGALRASRTPTKTPESSAINGHALDDAKTPSRRRTTPIADADRVLTEARESARKTRVESARRESRMRIEEREAARSASARRLSESTTLMNATNTRASIERVERSYVVQMEQSDDDMRTPVRVGTFRTTRLIDGVKANGAQRGDATRRASLTPPKALRMSVMSPTSSSGVREDSSFLAASTSEVTTVSTATTSTVNSTGADARARETEIERLKAKIAAITRDVEALSVEKQQWLSERVRMAAMMSAAEEDLKTTEARMAKTESRLKAHVKERDDALNEAERLRHALAQARMEVDSAVERQTVEFTTTTSKYELSIREYQMKTERLETLLLETETKIEADESAIKKLKQELAKSEADLRATREQLLQYKSSQEGLESENTRFKSDVSRLEDALTQSNRSLEEVTAQLRAAQVRDKDRTRKVEDLEKENEKLREDISRLNDSVALTNSTMRQKDEAIDAAHEDSERARAERNKTLEEMNSLRAELKTKNNVIENDKKEKEDMSASLKEVRAALSTKTVECRGFETEVDTLKEEIAALRAKLDKEVKRAMTSEEKSESAKEAFAARLAAATEKHASFQGRLNEMKSSMELERKKMEEEARAEVESLTAELQQLQRKLVERESAYESASKNVIVFERKLEITVQQLTDAKSELASIRSKVVQGELQGVELEHLREELADANERLNVMEKERSEHMLQLKNSKKEISELVGKIAGLEGAADLASEDRDKALEKLHEVEQEAAAAAKDSELAAELAAKDLMVANSQVSKLERQVQSLKQEVNRLREQNETDVEAIQRQRDTSSAAFTELQKKLDVAQTRVSELMKEIEALQKSSERDRKLLEDSERRLKAESESRSALEEELAALQEKYASAETRVYEVNTEMLLLNKELERERLNGQRHATSDADELKEMKVTRDEALSRIEYLKVDLAKVTAERDLLQQSIVSMEKRLEHERLAFAAQVKEAVKDAIRSKELEMTVIRKELDAIQKLSASGDNASEALKKALDDKERNLSRAQEVISELRANLTSLTHQLEHSNELLARARRDASVSHQEEHDELLTVRLERDEVKRVLHDVQAQLSDALAAKEWFERQSAAQEGEMKALREAAAAAAKMSEQARAQLARYKNISPKHMISPVKSRAFGSPTNSQLASPLKWFSRQTERVEPRTPPNNLFSKFSMATPTVPTRTPGGSWRAPSRPETLEEALEMLVMIGSFIFLVLVFLVVTSMFGRRVAFGRMTQQPPLVVDCGMFYRANDAVLGFAHDLLGLTYRSLCAENPPS